MHCLLGHCTYLISTSWACLGLMGMVILQHDATSSNPTPVKWKILDGKEEEIGWILANVYEVPCRMRGI